MEKKLVLKNYFLFDNQQLQADSLSSFLIRQQLHGTESRNRTRFIRIIGERSKEIEDERKKMLEEQCEKNKEGKMIYLTKEGKETLESAESVTYKIKDIKSFNKEWSDYLNEDYIIDITAANEEIIRSVKNIVLNTSESFSQVMAIMYEDWCTCFETAFNELKKGSEEFSKKIKADKETN